MVSDGQPDSRMQEWSPVQVSSSTPYLSNPAVIAANHAPESNWDPVTDFQMMSRNVRGFMSLFHSDKPVVCKVHGFCVAGGTDMALCSDLLVIADDVDLRAGKFYPGPFQRAGKGKGAELVAIVMVIRETAEREKAPKIVMLQL